MRSSNDMAATSRRSSSAASRKLLATRRTRSIMGLVWPARARQAKGSATPARRDQAALAVGGERDVGRVERVAIPELAGDLLVLLVEGFAVVGELAAPDLGAAAFADLGEPVRIGEALARRGDEVGLAAREQALGLREFADAAGRDHRRRQAGRAHGRADL